MTVQSSAVQCSSGGQTAAEQHLTNIAHTMIVKHQFKTLGSAAHVFRCGAFWIGKQEKQIFFRVDFSSCKYTVSFCVVESVKYMFLPTSCFVSGVSTSATLLPFSLLNEVFTDFCQSGMFYPSAQPEDIFI